MELMDFTELLNTFGVPIKIYPKKMLEGRFVGTEWKTESIANMSPVEVSEPFIPSSLSTRQPVATAYQDSGKNETYDMVWYSKLVIDLKSIVEHNGLLYSVEKATPFTDYSNVTQYELNGVKSFGNL